MKNKYFCKICNKELKGKATQWCLFHYREFMAKRPQNGENNPMWKGGKTQHSRGYVYIKNREHPFADKQGYIFEHRLVMEKHLNRLLNPKEIVHHINGIRNDNRIENLQLMTQAEHLKIHNLLGTHIPKRDSITGKFIKN